MKSRANATMPYAQYLFGPSYRSNTIRHAVKGWARRDENHFAARFLSLALFAWLIYSTFQSNLGSVKSAMVDVIVLHANLLGLAASAQNEIVSFAGGAYMYRVTNGCTGIFSMMLFVAAVIGYPASGGARAIGVCAGVPLLAFVNHVRLLSLGWIGVHHPSLVAGAHDIWWQAFLVVVTGIGWLAWLRLVVERGQGRSSSAGEMLKAVSLCFFMMGLFVALAIWTGVDDAYGRLIDGAASSLISLPNEVRMTFAPVIPASFYYGLLCSMIALFVAAPRIPALVKLKGVALWAVIPCVALQVVISATSILWRADPNLTTMTSVGFTIAASMIVPMASWYTWIRRNTTWTEMRSQQVCPRCGIRQLDIVDHLRKKHGVRSRRALDAVLRAHPELTTTQERAGGAAPPSLAPHTGRMSTRHNS